MPRAVIPPVSLFVSLVLCGLLITLAPTRAADVDTPSANSDVYCYISISNGAEFCYYVPPNGYTCDSIGNASDPVAQGFTECSMKGVCYANMAGNTEVCYYLQPFGYQCYFNYDARIIANMTHCDHLKSNLPPTIDITPPQGADSTDEDTVLPIKWILIDDPDSRASEPEDGKLELTFTATRGKVGFDAMQIADLTDRAACEAILNPASGLPSGDFAEFSVGNGTLAPKLVFRLRATPIQTLMKALVFLPELNWNTAKGGGSRLTIFADDRGNSGGIPENAENSVVIFAKPVNDAPIARIATNLQTLEDTPLTLTGAQIGVSDVDVEEGNNAGLLDVTITVLHGTFTIIGSGLAKICTQPQPCLEFKLARRQLYLRSSVSDITNNILNGKLTYTPDKDYFGTDTITVLANDLGNTGSGGPKSHSVSATITIISVNDAPELIHPNTLYTDEDTALVGLNITVKDVDTTTGLTVKMTVSHGVLSCPSTTPPTVSQTTVFQDNINLAAVQAIFTTTTYFPNPDYNGIDTLRVEIDDILYFSIGSSEGKKTIDNIPLAVVAVNDPPVFHISCPTTALCPNVPEAAFTGTLVIPIGSSGTFASPGTDTEPYIWITDVDVATSEIQVFIHVTYGRISVAPAKLANVRVAFPAGGAAAGPFSTVMFFGTLTNVNAVLNGMTYTRQSSGLDEITVLISDQGNTGKGLTGTDFITIAVSE